MILKFLVSGSHQRTIGLLMPSPDLRLKRLLTFFHSFLSQTTHTPTPIEPVESQCRNYGKSWGSTLAWTRSQYPQSLLCRPNRLYSICHPAWIKSRISRSIRSARSVRCSNRRRSVDGNSEKVSQSLAQLARRP